MLLKEAVKSISVISASGNISISDFKTFLQDDLIEIDSPENDNFRLIRWHDSETKFYTLMDKRADFTNYGQQLASEELPQLMLTCHALFMWI